MPSPGSSLPAGKLHHDGLHRVTVLAFEHQGCRRRSWATIITAPGMDDVFARRVSAPSGRPDGVAHGVEEAPFQDFHGIDPGLYEVRIVRRAGVMSRPVQDFMSGA
jgi:hypothetical protein